MTKAYSTLFTWRYPVNDHVVGHHDGTISVAIVWSGLNYATLSIDERQQQAILLNSAFALLPEDIVYEHHLFRFYDDSRCDAYVAQSDRAVRFKEIGRKARTDAAKLLADHAMDNSICTVFSLSRFTVGGYKSQFELQRRAVDVLMEKIQSTLGFLPDSKLLTVSEYGDFVQRVNSPDRARNKHSSAFSPLFHLSDQWVGDKPVWDKDCLKVGETFIWVGLIDLYPDQVYQGWSEFLANRSGGEFHLCQVVRPVDARQLILKAEKKAKNDVQEIGRRGGLFKRKVVEDTNAWAMYMASNNIPAAKSCFIIKIQHTDKKLLTELRRTAKQYVESSGGRVRDSKELQFVFWRTSHPGQGYLSKFMRPDALDLVSAMSPCNVHGGGMQHPLMMRLSAQNKIVYFDLPDGSPNHGFSAGKTRSGKGAEKVQRILETYPMGIDFYCLEYGGSYRWVVEMLGGTYITLDPDKVFINPFPTYEEADLMVNDEGELSAAVVAFSIAALAPILTGNKTSFDDVDDGQHHVARATAIFEYLYKAEREEDKKAPTFGDFLEIAQIMKEAFEDNSDKGQDYRSCVYLYENLNSFLSEPTGKRFNRADDGLDLTGSCIGIDIKPIVSTGDAKLLKIYLTSIFMRLTNKVISNRRKAEFVIDEYHVPAKLAPELTTNLASLAAKTWAKENGILEIISQSPDHVDAGDGDISSNMSHLQFMYMKDGHRKFADKFGMPEHIYNIWKGYKDPSAAGYKFRQCIRQVGDEFFDLKVILPKWILLVAETGPKALDIKDFIDRHYPELKGDIWQKISLFERFDQELTGFDNEDSVYEELVTRYIKKEQIV